MKKHRLSCLFFLGLLLIAGGLIGLYRGPEISQYAFLPGKTEAQEILTQAEKKWTGSFPAVSLHGWVENVSLTAGDRTQGEVTLWETMGGYFEIYPRRFVLGRPLSRGDGTDRVIVLDRKLAFQLFGDQDPLGQEVVLEEKHYLVVGVAEYTRGVGDTGEYAAWIPLEAEDAPAAAAMVLSAGGPAGSSLRTVFETVAREACGGGQEIFLSKERSRGTVMLRVVIMVIAICLLAVWIRFFVKLAGGWIQELRETMKTRYPRQMMGRILGRGAEILLLTALTVGAGAGLVAWGAQLMMIFPEWVPEVLVDPESIARRFRELTAAAASPVRFMTPELAEIRFWSGAIRWGIVIALLALALGKAKEPDTERPGATGD